MPKISDATSLKFNGSDVVKAYLGTTLVWSKGPIIRGVGSGSTGSATGYSASAVVPMGEVGDRLLLVTAKRGSSQQTVPSDYALVASQSRGSNGTITLHQKVATTTGGETVTVSFVQSNTHVVAVIRLSKANIGDAFTTGQQTSSTTSVQISPSITPTTVPVVILRLLTMSVAGAPAALLTWPDPVTDLRTEVTTASAASGNSSLFIGLEPSPATPSQVPARNPVSSQNQSSAAITVALSTST